MNMYFTRVLIAFLQLSLLFLACTTEEPDENPSSLGIYSESGSTLNPDVDSFIGSFSGYGGDIELLTDFSETKDGSESLKAILSVNASISGYAGWFISWGKQDVADDNNYVRDMSDYNGGSIIFWVKSPINLEVGIRSGNVDAGDETSKVLLNNFSSFAPDNTWRRVCIPLSKFKDKDFRTDFSKIKVFFVIASNTPSGGTGGTSKSFWVDDVRWEKNSCE